MLNYVATYENVQIVFLLVIAVCIIGYMVNRRIMKVQDYDHEENRESRRERFMALPNANKTKTIDNEGE